MRRTGIATRTVTAALCAAVLVGTPATAVAAGPATVAAEPEQHAGATRIASLGRAEVAAYLADHGLDAAAARHGVDLYRVVYPTSGVDGRRTVASTLVVLPRRTHGRRLPVVAWLHGTRAYRGDVASVSDNLDRAAAVQFATAGYATVAPDYLGLGAGQGRHPYMVAEPTVTASVDALRAARRLARLDREVYVAGFSQGGQAAMLLGRELRRGGLLPRRGDRVAERSARHPGRGAPGRARRPPRPPERHVLPGVRDGRLEPRVRPVGRPVRGVPCSVRHDDPGPVRQRPPGGRHRGRPARLAGGAVHRVVPGPAGEPDRCAAPGPGRERHRLPRLAARRPGPPLHLDR
ncbi:hypothetical protein [Actinophytocola gossypii]|uniref:Secretory lipase n=1 Tax=Actinophytocola gossypii TaxID=2812003 RepID=A0ABT2JAR1_9PSEU|nr:hypothetical protein [Actinophytocola gossypii]MCT2584937.1 hypothetical protein [Actinophytocola gossypii]